MKITQMVETTEERHSARMQLQNEAINAEVYVTFWDGLEYDHVYTWIQLYGKAWNPVLVGMEIVNMKTTELNQYFVWKEIELGITHKEVK